MRIIPALTFSVIAYFMIGEQSQLSLVEHLSTAITLVPLMQCQKFLETFQITCLNPTFRWGPNLSFFGLGPWAITIHGIAKLADIFISQNEL